MTISPRVNIKVNWGFEKDISLHIWGSATFSYMYLSRPLGILHPQTPASSKEKDWDTLWLLVGLGTTWAPSPSPDGSVHETAQPVLGLTLNSHFQPEGVAGALGFSMYQPWSSLFSVSEMWDSSFSVSTSELARCFSAVQATLNFAAVRLDDQAGSLPEREDKALETQTCGSCSYPRRERGLLWVEGAVLCRASAAHAAMSLAMPQLWKSTIVQSRDQGFLAMFADTFPNFPPSSPLSFPYNNCLQGQSTRFMLLLTSTAIGRHPALWELLWCRDLDREYIKPWNWFWSRCQSQALMC